MVAHGEVLNGKPDHPIRLEEGKEVKLGGDIVLIVNNNNNDHSVDIDDDKKGN